MRKASPISFAAATVLLAAGAVQAQARDYITIVGSSTVYPFTTAVAEQFGRSTRFRTPKVESTGTGGGLKLFCNGVGVAHPDVVNASRRIKPGEVEACRRNGVKEIVEVKVGYDGLTLAQSRRSEPMRLTLRDVWLALARQVPDPARPGELIANPHRTWKDVNPALPARRIEVLGPPPTSGTRDSFAEMVLEGGCKTFDWIKALAETDGNRFRAICHTIREDGAYVEAGENDNLIVQKIEANPGAIGVFGYSFLEENQDKLVGLPLQGVAPTFDTIASGEYPAARPLFIYVKKAHVDFVPGLKEFVAEYVSARALGEEGYLADKGLVPPAEAELAKIRTNALSLANLEL